MGSACNRTEGPDTLAVRYEASNAPKFQAQCLQNQFEKDIFMTINLLR